MKKIKQMGGTKEEFGRGIFNNPQERRREVPSRHKGGAGRFHADIREAQRGSKQTLGRRREVLSRHKGGAGRFQADTREA